MFVLRALLLAAAAGVVALGFVLARHRDRAAASAGGQYVCPMHPEVTSNGPGECPICGMALVKAGTFTRDAMMDDAMPPEAADAIAAAQMLPKAASGVAPNLVGYYPSPVRQHVLRYEVYAPAWVEKDGRFAVLVYSDQLPSLSVSEVAEFTPTGDPSVTWPVQLGPGDPERWDRSMSLVHFVAQAPPADLKPGLVGWVKFPRRPRAMNVIPAMAVLESEEGPYVLVFSRAKGTASKRSIEYGRITTGLAAVLSGLKLREMVVSVNAFFWDAERRLQAEQRAPNEGMP